MQGGVESSGRDWALLARAAAVGGAAAFVLFYALYLGAGWPPREASELTFPLAALPFAVGLLGWSAVLMSGRALENYSRELGISESWTVESGRQAMALLIAFGLGGMVGAAVAGMPFGV